MMGDALLKQFLKFFILLGIRPQDENRLRHSFSAVRTSPDAVNIRKVHGKPKEKVTWFFGPDLTGNSQEALSSLL